MVDSSVNISIPAPLDSVTLCGQGEEGRQVVLLQKQLREQDQSLHQTRRALQNIATQFAQLQEQFVQEAESQLVNLSVEIAQKVLMQTIDKGAYEIDPIVSEALASVQGCKKVTVHLNPQDLKNCNAAKTQEDDGNLTFVADPSIRRAECRVETTQGTVLASVDQQMSEISEELTGE